MPSLFIWRIISPLAFDAEEFLHGGLVPLGGPLFNFVPAGAETGATHEMGDKLDVFRGCRGHRINSGLKVSLKNAYLYALIERSAL